jgi:hypothetical protein
MTTYTKRVSLIATLMCLVAHAVTAQVTVNTEKTIDFVLKNNGKLVEGTAKFGQNEADDFDTKGKHKPDPVPSPFTVEQGKESFKAFTHTAQEGDVHAKTTISVGIPTVGAKTIAVQGKIKIDISVPVKIANDKGGKATANGKIDLAFKSATLVELNGSKLKDPMKVKPKIKANGGEKVSVKDPIRLELVGNTFGETLAEDVFEAYFDAGDGGEVGYNTSDRLELTTLEASGSFAEVRSATLVSWATDLTGTARLANGVLALSGIFSPAGPITDYWDLTYSLAYPGYIINAELKPGAIGMELSMTPPLTTVDTFDLCLSGSMAATVEESCLDTSYNYCTAGTSASGCAPQISACGTASASAPSGFVASVNYIEGERDGLFFYGQNGRQANSWGLGSSFICVVPPVQRGGLLSAVGNAGSCDGVFCQDLNSRWCPSCPKSGHAPSPGQLLQVQFWYRDPFNTSNMTTSMTDAFEVPVSP